MKKIRFDVYSQGWNFGAPYAIVTASTMAIYSIYTLVITQWRTQFRRRMNQLDNEVRGKKISVFLRGVHVRLLMRFKGATLAVDSLINYETVKYYNNEELEANRYDNIMASWLFTSKKSKKNNQESLAKIFRRRNKDSRELGNPELGTKHNTVERFDTHHVHGG